MESQYLFTFLELPDPELELFNQTPLFDTFTLFPKLPIELREMIWKAALPKNRKIHLQSKRCSWNGNSAMAFKSRTPPPLIFHTNHESRVTAIPYYISLLGTLDSGFPCTYFNPHLDTVSSSCTMNYLARYSGPSGIEVTFDAISERMLSRFRLIHFLEFRTWDWAPVEEPDMRIMSPMVGDDADVAQREMLIGYLPSLKKLHLLTDDAKLGCCALIDFGRQYTCVESLQIFMRNRSYLIPEFQYPEITFTVTKAAIRTQFERMYGNYQETPEWKAYTYRKDTA